MRGKYLLAVCASLAVVALVATSAQAGIRPANVYRADQIEAKDIVLRDAELQELMQSDLFHKVVTAKDAKALAQLLGTDKNAAFAGAVSRSWSEMLSEFERRPKHQLDEPAPPNPWYDDEGWWISP